MTNPEELLQLKQDLVNEHFENLKPKVKANDKDVKTALNNILNEGLTGLEDVTNSLGSQNRKEGDAENADALNACSKEAREDTTTDPLELLKQKQGILNLHLANLKVAESDDPDISKKLAKLDEQLAQLDLLVGTLAKSDDPEVQKRAHETLRKLRDASLNPQGTLNQ